eukprot:g3075.t1
MRVCVPATDEEKKAHQFRCLATNLVVDSSQLVASYIVTESAAQLRSFQITGMSRLQQAQLSSLLRAHMYHLLPSQRSSAIPQSHSKPAQRYLQPA